jgi:hypothetical protein
MNRRINSCLLAVLLALVAPPAAIAQEASVDVALDTFGPGGVYRPGDFVAIRVTLGMRPGAALDVAAPVWVQWDVTNADGDVAEYGRAITLNRQTPQSVWLSAPLPPDTDARSVFPIRVFDFTDGRRGRELGGRLITPPGGTFVRPDLGMIGVVGSRQLGLGQLALPVANGFPIYTAHENTLCVFNLDPRKDFPDRWEGLACFGAIVWAQAQPELSATQSEALREWIRRGGHFVIVLPEETNPWGLGEVGTTDLHDLLPGKAPRKDDDVPIEALLPVLAKARGIGGGAQPGPVSIHVFADLGTAPSWSDNFYEPLIALPDGRAVVVQRLYGHGRITVCGIDLANARFNTLPLSNGMLSPLPQADAFWNRVLGRRADTPLAGEITQIDQASRLATGSPSERKVGGAALFLNRISMSGKAAAGLGVAVLLFLGYWFVAGPGAYFVLKHHGRARHSWLAFAAAAGVFTAIAWGAANALRDRSMSIQHVTILDHIARAPGAEDRPNDPQLQRAVSFLSLYVHGYANTPVSIESSPGQRDLLVPWWPPDEAVQKFPDVDRYTVNVDRNPDDYELPSRSTATQFFAHWLGAVNEDEWGGGMLRPDPADPLRVEPDGFGGERLMGGLTSDLPGTLRNVVMIWVWNRRVPPRAYQIESQREMPWVPALQSGRMLNIGRMWSEGDIAPGATIRPQPKDDGSFHLDRSLDATYVAPLRGGGLFDAPGMAQRDPEWRRAIEMLSFFHQLPPPPYMKEPGDNDPARVNFLRLLGRELDLSAWFSRPCVILIGYLQGAECPIPIRAHGERVPATEESVTVVRWICPLEVLPEVAFPVREGDDAAGDAGSGIGSGIDERRASGDEAPR